MKKSWSFAEKSMGKSQKKILMQEASIASPQIVQFQRKIYIISMLFLCSL